MTFVDRLIMREEERWRRQSWVWNNYRCYNANECLHRDSRWALTAWLGTCTWQVDRLSRSNDRLTAIHSSTTCTRTWPSWAATFGTFCTPSSPLVDVPNISAYLSRVPVGCQRRIAQCRIKTHRKRWRQDDDGD